MEPSEKRKTESQVDAEAQPEMLKQHETETSAGPVSLKDRTIVRVKALQQSAPILAAHLRTRFTAGVSATRMRTTDLAKVGMGKISLDKIRFKKIGLDRLNRETLRAGRDRLASNVEALLKPRAINEAPATDKSISPPQSSAVGTSVTRADTDRADLSALKAKLDAALRPKDNAALRDTDATTELDKASVGIAARIAAALPKSQRAKSQQPQSQRDQSQRAKPIWSAPFAGLKRQFSAYPSPSAAGNADAGHGRNALAPDISPLWTTRTERLKTERIVARTRPKRSFLTLGMFATALVTGALLHIITTFAIPALSSSWFRWSAFDRMKGQLEINAMKVWPIDPTGAMPLPFLSPDMRYAFCRFDITSGPVLVSAVLPEAGWSLALYTPAGDNFYAVPGQDGRLVEAVFNIVPASDRLLIPIPGQRRADVDAAQVTSTARQGLVVIRAPNKGAASLPAVEIALRRAKCVAVERR